MRPVPPLKLVAKSQSLLYPTLSATATPTSIATCRGRPYSNSNHFEANGVAVLIILTCGLACALALCVAIRCFLRGSGSHIENQQEVGVEQRKSSVEVVQTSHANSLVLVYSAGAGSGGIKQHLAGEEVECVICLSEFVEGDVIQVLGRCKHGFHVSCIRKWLSSHYSCPTCRCSTTTTTPCPPSQSLQEAADTQTQPQTQEGAGA